MCCSPKSPVRYSFQSNMKLNRDDQYEEDVFYAELRAQILLLTADDDEDEDFVERKRSNSSNLNATKSSSMHGLTSLSSALQPGSYFNWWEFENTNSVPTWLVNLWRNGNGTGVFIPHIVKSRRYKPGRTRNQRTKTYSD
ncbi:hypothetical protein OWV82_016723 [Melia azedarach]|uniref:Uncharacterized protein n=1 Tax=Melia azedarach TaxID=155640 RepID=A0ACC1XHX9_MELAZ|nr:hypothetical protein OWV82_016723 [Melia azedarach]